MLQYPNIDPVAISFGPIAVHWYGLMYLLAFAGGWFLAKYQVRRRNLTFTGDDLADLLFFCAIGTIVGGRLGSILFYNFEGFLQNPRMLIFGGMSFHGGLIGVLIAMGVFAKRRGRKYFDVADLVAPVAAFGLGAGRLGNFINGELWGRVTDVPWGMVFPHVGPEPRHPSQLYQFFLEGVVLFLMVWIFARKPRPMTAVSGLFVMGYGCQRFFVEFFRQPDSHIGFQAFDWLTRGQMLSLPMIVAGAILIWLGYKRGVYAPTSESGGTVESSVTAKTK